MVIMKIRMITMSSSDHIGPAFGGDIEKSIQIMSNQFQQDFLSSFSGGKSAY